MKIFQIEDFDEKTLGDFIEFSNMNGDEHWNIILNSPGGLNWVYSLILHELNKNYRAITLTVVEASSNAFRLILNFKGKVDIIDGALLMYHLARFSPDILVNNKRRPYNSMNYPEIHEKNIKNIYDSQLEECSKFMSKEQLEHLKSGHDIYFFKRRSGLDSKK